MTSYISQHQTKIEEFRTPFELKLSPKNRWVKLTALLPWDTLANIYNNKLSGSMGRKSVNARVVIGALIIKHKLNLTDEETLLTISENPYMQFFLGFEVYQPDPLFSPTLFVEIRKRLGEESFDEFNKAIIHVAFPPNDAQTGEQCKNKGKLQIDATVADQYIKYPNDLDLVNKAREESEKLIDYLYKILQPAVKPRTYRKVARQRYLSVAKKKKKTKAEIRKAIRYLLNALNRNLNSINKMLDEFDPDKFPLNKKQQKALMVLHTLYEQQKEMYDQKKNTVDHRIVSISQPHVRPIVRGKLGKKGVEFGAKIGLSLMDGFARVDTLSWEAYNESNDLKRQAEAYKAIFGHYPELIQADKIYTTNENRKWCRLKNIRITAKPKGKPVEKTYREKKKEKQEFNERNHIEGKFGQAKQGYMLNEVRAKLKDTSESWIGVVVFVLNIIKLTQINGLTF
jgi:DNA-directed RNA polymerase subunit E'/Rpb7